MASKPKSLKHSGEPWTSPDKQKLAELAKKNTPTGVIGLKLGRSKDAIYSEASKLGINLHPINKSPYNRTKK